MREEAPGRKDFAGCLLYILYLYILSYDIKYASPLPSFQRVIQENTVKIVEILAQIGELAVLRGR